MRLIISSTSVSSTVTVNFAFWVEPFEANERFPELAPFGAFDEISSVSPLYKLRGHRDKIRLRHETERDYSAAPASIVSAVPNENKVPCGDWLGSLPSVNLGKMIIESTSEATL